MEADFGELLTQFAQGGDMVLMAVGDEDVAKLELVLGDQFGHGSRLPAGVEQRRLARDFVPHQVAIDGHAARSGGDAAQLAPGAQVLLGRQPAVGDGLQLARMQADQCGQRGQIGFLRRLAGLLQRRQFRLRQPGRPRGGCG